MNIFLMPLPFIIHLVYYYLVKRGERKVNTNSEFLSQWKPQHEKGILFYIIPSTLILLICLVFLTFLIYFIYKPNDIGKMTYVFINNTVIFLILTSERLYNWVKSEKRYKKIISIIKENAEM